MGNESSTLLDTARDAAVRGDLLDVLQQSSASSSKDNKSNNTAFDLNVRYSHDYLGYTLAHFAAQHNQRGVLEYLSSQRALSASILDDLDRTPLFVAVEYGSAECVEYLLSQNNNNDDDDDGEMNIDEMRAIRGPHSHGWSVYHAACASGNAKVLTMLLERARNVHDCRFEYRYHNVHINARGEKVIEESNIDNWQPLLVAVAYGHYECVQTWCTENARLDLEYDINAARSDGVTAIAWAAANGRADMLEVLFEHGARLDDDDVAINSDERRRPSSSSPSCSHHQRRDVTPLHWAAQHGHAHTCAILLDHDDEFQSLRRARDARGFTAFLHAAQKGFTQVVREFLERDDSDINDANLLGETALHLAVRGRHVATVHLLLDHRADRTRRDGVYGYIPLDVCGGAGNTVSDRLLRSSLRAGRPPPRKPQASDGGSATVRYGNIDLGGKMFYRGESVYKTYSPQRVPDGDGSMYLNRSLVYTGGYREGLRRGRGMQILDVLQQTFLVCDWHDDMPQYDTPVTIGYRFGETYRGHVVPRSGTTTTGGRGPHDDCPIVKSPEELLQQCPPILSREGVGSMSYAMTDVIYYGRWCDDLRQGFGIQVRKLGGNRTETLYCHFEHGVPHGPGVRVTAPDGDILVGTWSCEHDGQFTGHGSRHRPDGTIVTGEWKGDDCLTHAVHEKRNESGAAAEQGGGGGVEMKPVISAAAAAAASASMMLPGEKWGGLFDGLVVVPMRLHDGDDKLDASDLGMLYNHVWRAMCKNGPFTSLTKFVQGWMSFRYVDHVQPVVSSQPPRHHHHHHSHHHHHPIYTDLTMAVDDIKAFAMTLSRFVCVYLHNTWSQHVVTQAIVEVLLHLIAPVLAPLYRLDTTHDNFDYQARATVLSGAKPSQFGVDDSVLPPSLDAITADEIAAYVAKVDKALSDVRYRPEYRRDDDDDASGGGEDVDVEDGKSPIVTDAMLLRQLCEEYAREALATLQDDETGNAVPFPRTLAMMSALGINAVPRFKLAHLYQLYEVMDEEMQEYAAQNGAIGAGQDGATRDNVFLYLLAHASPNVNMFAECRYLADWPTEDEHERTARITLSNRIAHFRVLSVRSELGLRRLQQQNVNAAAAAKRPPLSPAGALGRNPVCVVRDQALELPLGHVRRAPYLQALSPLLQHAHILSSYAVPGMPFLEDSRDDPNDARFDGLFIDPVMPATLSILSTLGIVVRGEESGSDNDDKDKESGDEEEEEEGEAEEDQKSAVTIRPSRRPHLVWECILDAAVYADAVACVDELAAIGAVMAESDASAGRRYPFVLYQPPQSSAAAGGVSQGAPAVSGQQSGARPK